MSAGTRVAEAEGEAGGMIARLGETKVEEAAEEDGGMIALLQGEAHLQDEAEARHIAHLQGGEVLLRRGLASSWHQGLLEVLVEVVEVAGENGRSRRRNLGALEAEMETVLPGVTLLPGGVEVDVTLLQGEGLLQEGVHLQGEEAPLAGMRGEAMLEVGDVEVEALLQDEALHQGGVLLQGVARLQGEVPLQDVEVVLMMEVALGGLGLAEEVKTGALQEGDRLQGEVPLLVGALHLAVGLLLGEVVHLKEEATRHAGDLHLAEMRAVATEVPGGAVEEEVVDLHLDVGLHLGEDLHPGEDLHLAVMDLPATMDLQTGGATVQQGTIELHHQDPTIARRQDPMTELLPSPLASLTKAGPRWPSVKPTWSSLLGRFDFKALPALPWPHPLSMWVAL